MLHTACGLFGLISYHGTQLFFDENTGWVSHATADQSPKNLALQVSGGQGRILVFGCRLAHVCQIHFLDHDSLPILQKGIAEPNVEVTECAHNAIALQINGTFLSADSDGLVRANSNWCRDWELYTVFAIPCARLTNLFGLSGTKSMNGAFSLDLQSKPAQADIFGKPRASTAEPCFTIAGFFNRSTSLDAVNRRLALELEKKNPGRCRIISNNFLLDNASPNDQSKLSEMSTRPQPTDRFHIIIHQRWPVTPPAPRGHLTIAYFFWEESMVRRDIVEILNMFDGVIVSAAFIKKSLILSGLQKPIFVVGYSPNLEQFAAIHSKKAVEQQAVRPFTFLHVSSCFPLKGVDVLLQAYAKTFSRKDSVRLIIKGYPNVLNKAAEHVGKVRDAYPDMAELIFINDDVSEDSLLDLYKNSDAMVLPSRGEGFNLPAAEAIAAGLKLIVTGYGGHMDYCYPGSARFIKYRFEKSQYMVTDGKSLWAEPELDDLCAGLKEVMEGRFEVRQEAREKTLAALRSERWIARIEDAVNSLVNMCFE